MNVLLITQHFAIHGGSDVMVHQTKALLEAAGHRAYIYAARSADMPDDGIYPGDAHFSRPKPANLWKFLYSPEARSRLEAFLEVHDIDVAHLHIHYGTLTSSILKPLKDRGIRIVQHLHEYRSFCPVYTAQRNDQTCTSCRVGHYVPSLRHRCNRGSLVRSGLTAAEMYVADFLGAKTAPDLFLTVSDFQRDLVIGQGLDPERVRTLYNPVRSEFLHSDTGDIARTGVLFAGRIEAYKGIFDVLDLAARMADTHFKIAGTGNALAKARLSTEQRNLKNVTFLGQLTKEDLIVQLQQSLCFIVPSRWNETFGLTAVEAMASGTIPIVTHMGGLTEVVEDGQSGFIVEMGDVAAMASNIVTLKENKATRDRLARQGAERVRRLFSEEQYVTRLKEAYGF